MLASSKACARPGCPRRAIQLVPTTDREAVGEMLRGLNGAIDVIVPRGGKSLVQRVQEEARVPVFAHLEGICHTYVDRAANMDIAVPIVVNAKMRRTGVCGATECLLVDKNARDDFFAPLVKALLDAGCEVRGDAAAAESRSPRQSRQRPTTTARNSSTRSSPSRLVDGVDGAIDHIARYGSQHTDAIITEDEATAERFLEPVDSRHRAAQRLDAVRRRRRIRLRRRNRHRDRQDACARPGRRRAADELQIQGARQRPDPAEVIESRNEARLELTRKIPLQSFGSLRVRTPLCLPGQRIGMMGGSFNPPHDGHRLAAEAAMKRLGLISCGG